MKFKNEIILTGTIQNLPERSLPMQDGMLIGFDLQVYRKPKHNDSELKYDNLRVIVFNDDEFLHKYQNGDRLSVRGFLQCRNYTIDDYAVNEKVQSHVQNYVELFEQFPCNKKPQGKRREIIDWSYIVNAGLIGDMPKDSLYRSSTEKVGSPRTHYVYTIDKDKFVFKETQHTYYEVIATKYKKLDTPCNPKKGDKNIATLVGKLISKYTHDPSRKYTVTNLKIMTRTKFFPDIRTYYNNAIVWDDSCLSKTRKFQVDDYISIVGRLQSRNYTKEIIVKKKGNNTTRKVVLNTFRTVEISVSKLEQIHNFVEEAQDAIDIK